MIIRVVCDADILVGLGDRVLAWVVKDTLPLHYSLPNLLLYLGGGRRTHTTTLEELDLVLCTFKNEWVRERGGGEGERAGVGEGHHHNNSDDSIEGPLSLGEIHAYLDRRGSMHQSVGYLLNRIRSTGSTTTMAPATMYHHHYGTATTSNSTSADGGGGVGSDVIEAAVNLLLECGDLNPVSMDATALSLNLRAGSSLILVSRRIFKTGSELYAQLRHVGGGKQEVEESHTSERGGDGEHSVVSNLNSMSIIERPTPPSHNPNPQSPIGSNPLQLIVDEPDYYSPLSNNSQNAPTPPPPDITNHSNSKTEEEGGGIVPTSSTSSPDSELIGLLSRLGLEYVLPTLLAVDITTIDELCTIRSGSLSQLLLDAHVEHHHQHNGLSRESIVLEQCAATYRQLAAPWLYHPSNPSHQHHSSNSVTDLLRGEGYSSDRVGRAYLLRTLQMTSSNGLSSLSVDRYRKSSLGQILSSLKRASISSHHLDGEKGGVSDNSNLEAALALFRVVAQKLVVEAGKGARLTAHPAAVYAGRLLPYAQPPSSLEGSQPYKAILRELFTGHTDTTLLRVWAHIRLLLDDPQWAGDDGVVDPLNYTGACDDSEDDDCATSTIPDSLDYGMPQNEALNTIVHEAVEILKSPQPHVRIPYVAQAKESLRAHYGRPRKLTTPFMAVPERFNDDEVNTVVNTSITSVDKDAREVPARPSLGNLSSLRRLHSGGIYTSATSAHSRDGGDNIITPSSSIREVVVGDNNTSSSRKGPPPMASSWFAAADEDAATEQQPPPLNQHISNFFQGLEVRSEKLTPEENDNSKNNNPYQQSSTERSGATPRTSIINLSSSSLVPPPPEVITIPGGGKPSTHHHNTHNSIAPPPEEFQWGHQVLHRPSNNNNNPHDHSHHHGERGSSSSSTSSPISNSSSTSVDSSRNAAGYAYPPSSGGERGPSVDVMEVFEGSHYHEAPTYEDRFPTTTTDGGRRRSSTASSLAHYHEGREMNHKTTPFPSSTSINARGMSVLEGEDDEPLPPLSSGNWVPETKVGVSPLPQQQPSLPPSPPPPHHHTPSSSTTNHASRTGSSFTVPPPQQQQPPQHTPLALRYFTGGSAAGDDGDDGSGVGGATYNHHRLADQQQPLQVSRSISGVRPVDSGLSFKAAEEAYVPPVTTNTAAIAPTNNNKVYRKAVPSRAIDALLPSSTPRPSAIARRNHNNNNTSSTTGGRPGVNSALVGSRPTKPTPSNDDIPPSPPRVQWDSSVPSHNNNISSSRRPLEMEMLPNERPRPKTTMATTTAQYQPHPTTKQRTNTALPVGRTYSVEDALRELRPSHTLSSSSIPSSLLRK